MDQDFIEQMWGMVTVRDGQRIHDNEVLKRRKGTLLSLLALSIHFFFIDDLNLLDWIFK